MKIYCDNKEILDLDDAAIALLHNDLLDIEEWIRNMILGKVTACGGRFKAEWDQRLAQDPSVKSVPTNPSDYVAQVIKHPDYKTRAQREEAGRKLAEQEQAKTAQETAQDQPVAEENAITPNQ